MVIPNFIYFMINLLRLEMGEMLIKVIGKLLQEFLIC